MACALNSASIGILNLFVGRVSSSSGRSLANRMGVWLLARPKMRANSNVGCKAGRPAGHRRGATRAFVVADVNAA